MDSDLSYKSFRKTSSSPHGAWGSNQSDENPLSLQPETVPGLVGSIQDEEKSIIQPPPNLQPIPSPSTTYENQNGKSQVDLYFIAYSLDYTVYEIN